jgi:hypothetical protein
MIGRVVPVYVVYGRGKMLSITVFGTNGFVTVVVHYKGKFTFSKSMLL